MESPKELEKRLAVAECRIDKLEQMVLDNIDLINYLNDKYGKFIPKSNGIELGVIKGIESRKRIEQLHKELNGK
tara:strand:- start:140 stop:361 length:222 start_codon:yes stop_codon:yes gene_type:complete